MDHATQVRLIRTAFDAIDRGEPPLSEHFTRNRPDAYTSHERLVQEREILFKAHPLVVGFSAQIPNPGDFLTEDLAPVPILVVRTGDGALRAFVNICRHRGARLVRGCGAGAERFSCPYHAWTYGLDGGVIAIPDEVGFEGLDVSTKGLVALPIAERHGLIFVKPTPGAPIDGAEILGGLDDDIASYGIGAYVPVESRTVQRRMNWKLVSDTFWEAYHIRVLHAANVAPLFVRNLALFDAMGRNHRLVGVRKSIEKLRGQPEEKWDIVPHATLLMNVFPNTVLVMQSDHAEVYRIFPDRDHPSQSTAVISILAPGPAPKWNKTMELLLGVVAQDFEMGEGIQRNFESGAIREVMYGRYEAALEHFHRSIREALAEGVRLREPRAFRRSLETSS
jgi:phenylpropionate dioxygenase-like ring-hydroxylating dioxygenase large terminal subunit